MGILNEKHKFHTICFGTLYLDIYISQSFQRFSYNGYFYCDKATLIDDNFFYSMIFPGLITYKMIPGSKTMFLD